MSGNAETRDVENFKKMLKKLRDLRDEWNRWQDEDEFARQAENPLMAILDGSYSVSIDGKTVRLDGMFANRDVTLVLEVKSVDAKDGFCIPAPPPFPAEKKELLTILEDAMSQLYKK